MTPFKFKLEGLYRLRVFNEEVIKLELGKITKKMEVTRKTIGQLETHLQGILEDYQKKIGEKQFGYVLETYPDFIEKKRTDIKDSKKKLGIYQKDYAKKVKELEKARSDLRVIEKIKGSAVSQYKKAYNKKQEQIIEDDWIMKKGRPG